MDYDLIKVCDDVTKVIEAPKLERMWRDYQEYWENCGSDSMCFADLLYKAITTVETYLTATK